MEKTFMTLQYILPTNLFFIHNPCSTLALLLLQKVC